VKETVPVWSIAWKHGPKYGRLAWAILNVRLGCPVRPPFVTYLVTRRCNSRCIMCDSWKRRDGDRDMNLAEIERALTGIGPLDAIRLSGGEPFLREDFGEIVAIVNARCAPGIIHITSNGFLTERIARFVEEVPWPWWGLAEAGGSPGWGSTAPPTRAAGGRSHDS